MAVVPNMDHLKRLWPGPSTDPKVSSPMAVFAEQAATDAVTPPNGCAICGADKQSHGQRHGCGVTGGFGPWREPTTEQRKDRMYAARAQRLDGAVHTAALRLAARSAGPCRTCRQKPGTHAGECPQCFVDGVDLDARYER